MDRLFDIWLSLCLCPGAAELQNLMGHFGSAYEVFNAEESEIDALSLSPRLRRALLDKDLQESGRIWEYCKKNGVGILAWSDEEYPASLRPLRDPPAILYYRGRLPRFNRDLCISVVGTRSMSEYGKRMAYKIGYELAAAGAVVVSGMALGNDSVAAAGAIMAGGTTVAVLGCGIDVVYPKEHARFYEEITRRGVVMTEYPPGTPPRGDHFPVRNRIISGLSQGAVMVEGDSRSGALITMKTAILQGRDVYAFPGNVGETNSAGSNQLISDGAAVILSARDVLENYAFLYRDTLDMNRLVKAEMCSDADEGALARLGVYTRTRDFSQRVPPPEEHRKQVPHHRAAPPVDDSRARSVPKSAMKPPRSTSSKDLKEPSISVPPPRREDPSRRALESLTDTQRRVFEALPLDGTVTPDYLSREGFTMSEIMSAITILEIKGLVLTLPGGLVGRK